MTIQSPALKNNTRRETGLTGECCLQPEDFLALYEAYYPKVFNYLCYRCGDVHTAEDLTAHTFERALDHLGSYQHDRAPFGAWLFAIARNLMTDHLTAARKNACLPLDHIHGHPSNEPSPEEHIIQNELQVALLSALELLDDRERDLLALKFGARFTNRRIAAITGLGEANVGVIVYRSLRRLRAVLDGKETRE